MTMALSLTKKPEHVENSQAFERLPLDVILIVCDMLERPAQVMLALTCRRLRAMIAPDPNLGTYSIHDRIEISKGLEIDWPECLTCCVCGTLFDWKRRARFGYACPNFFRHSKIDKRDIWPTSVPTETDPKVVINFEVVDLIRRYYERGPQTGLSVAYLHQTGEDWKGRAQETRARWVDGQLIVHMKWKLELRAEQRNNQKLWTTIDICHHHNLHWLRWHGERREMYHSIVQQDISKLKCPYCATDAIVRHKILADTSKKVVVEAWRNYGNSRTVDSLYDQFFFSWGVAHIDRDVVARRDIQKLFESGTDA